MFLLFSTRVCGGTRKEQHAVASAARVSPSQLFFLAAAMSSSGSQFLGDSGAQNKAHSAPPPQGNTEPTTGTTPGSTSATPTAFTAGATPQVKRRTDPPPARQIPHQMPTPPDTKTAALAWVSATSELALGGAQTIRDGIQLLPAPIRRELTRHVVELSGYPPRRTGTTPPPKPERPAPKPDGRGRSRPAEAHPAAAAPAGPPRAVAKVASPTHPWGTAEQPNYAEEDTSAPPPPPAHPTTKMPRPTARPTDAQPKAPATPDDDADEEDHFRGFERCCTYRHPPPQFYTYYPKYRDEAHFRRRAERIKHDLEQPSAQSFLPWVPPELYSLQFNELDDVIELERRQAASDHAPPIAAATDAAYFYIRSLPAGVQGPRVPYWEDPHLVAGWCAHPCESGSGCKGRTSRCLRPIILGAGKPHAGHRCNQCHRNRDD